MQSGIRIELNLITGKLFPRSRVDKWHRRKRIRPGAHSARSLVDDLQFPPGVAQAFPQRREIPVDRSSSDLAKSPELDWLPGCTPRLRSNGSRLPRGMMDSCAACGWASCKANKKNRLVRQRAGTAGMGVPVWMQILPSAGMVIVSLPLGYRCSRLLPVCRVRRWTG
jgi:hypothetical protein